MTIRTAALQKKAPSAHVVKKSRAVHSKGSTASQFKKKHSNFFHIFDLWLVEPH